MRQPYELTVLRCPPRLRVSALKVLFLVPFLCLASPAFGWSSEAHEIACEIAWQRFTPAAKKLVHELRRADANPWKTFSASCSWADTVRDRDGSHPHTAAYHYVNVPPDVAGIDPQRDCSGAERCVTWAIAHYGRQLADRALDARSRAEALKFLAHFIADVHQPLHVGRLADRGGNEIAVDYFGDHGSCRPGRERNLHEVWDRHILARAGDRWPKAARRLDAAITAAQARAWSDTDILGWANESYRLCEDFVYASEATVQRCGSRRFVPIGETYHQRAVGIIRERLQQSGVRIAHVIDLAARGAIPWSNTEWSNTASRQR